MSTSATASFVAMTAGFARRYALTTLSMPSDVCARSLNPGIPESTSQRHKPDTRGLITGGYQTDDGDDHLWVVAELWQSTGDPYC